MGFASKKLISYVVSRWKGHWSNEFTRSGAGSFGGLRCRSFFLSLSARSRASQLAIQVGVLRGQLGKFPFEIDDGVSKRCRSLNFLRQCAGLPFEVGEGTGEFFGVRRQLGPKPSGFGACASFGCSGTLDVAGADAPSQDSSGSEGGDEADGDKHGSV